MFLTGKADAAIETLRKQIALDPSWFVAHGNLGWVYYHQRRFSEALVEFETMHKLDESGIFALEGLGSAYARMGKTNDARRLLGQMQELQRQGTDYRVGTAWLQYLLGDHESALDSLEKGMTERAFGVEGLCCGPGWEVLRPHPRAQAILRKMNLVSASATNAPPAVSQKSVAVLPFVNLSADKADEYLSDGMTEELLNALTKVKELRVPGRSSSFAFKGRNEEDIFRKVGEQLRVGAVLEGSVRKAGNQLRITAQLINVADGFHLWSETYDRDMTNIFAIQSEVARQVVAALKVQLGVEETRALSKKPTENVEAYNLYLLGRSHWGRYSADGWRRALDYFNQAIAKDPTYALAYAGKADAYDWLATIGMPAREAFEKGKLAAQRALELDDSLAEAHAAMGNVRFLYDWDWAAAENEYRRALQINPNLALARDAYGSFLATQGRFDEAIREQQRAIEQDPFSSYLNVDLGWIFYPARQYERAIEQARKGLDLDQNFGEGHRLLGWCYVWRGQTNEALAEMLKLKSLDDNPWNAAGLAYAYAISGKSKGALQIMQEWNTMPQSRHVAPSSRALVYLGLGDTNSALTWLEQACEVKDTLCPYANVDPVFDSVRSHPRFQAILRKVNLVK